MISLPTKVMAGLVFACFAALAQMGGYSGPQILSRSGGSGANRGGSHEGFSLYIGVYGSYETGVIPASVDAQGNIVSLSALYGIGLRYGVYGSRSWRHTTLGLDYSGNVRYYLPRSYYHGTDQILGLQIDTQVSRRLSLYSRTSGGILSSYYAGGPAYSSGLLSTPGYSPFDDRVYFLESMAGANYKLTNRLSFSVDGTGFFVRYRNASLVGMNGWGANGMLAYRLDRTRTLTLEYARVHYDYPRGFGESDLDAYLLGFSQSFSRRWQLALSGGATHVGTIGIEKIATDPLTSALFGISATVQAFQTQTWLGSGKAGVEGRFRHAFLSIFVSQMPNGGNGVYLTSKSTAANATFTYTGIRRLSLYGNARYDHMSSIGQQSIGSYSYFTGGGGASYQIKQYLDANLDIAGRNLQIVQTGGFARLYYRIVVGFNFHSGMMPVTFW